MPGQFLESERAMLDQRRWSLAATITRHVGVAEYGQRSITGFPVWLMWGLLHLRQLSDGHSQRSIVAAWLRLLITCRRSSLLIIEPIGNSPTSTRDYQNAA